MIETRFRPVYQQFLVTPVAMHIKKYPAHFFTLLGLLFGLMVVPFLLWGHVATACILLLLSGYCDTLDGTIARLQEKSSQLGCALDIIVDRVVEFVVIVGLFALDPSSRGWACLMMLGSILVCVTSFLVVGIFSSNNSEKAFHYSTGLMERAEAFIFFILMMLFPKYFFWFACMFVILVFLTALIRMIEFYKASIQVESTLKEF